MGKKGKMNKKQSESKTREEYNPIDDESVSLDEDELLEETTMKLGISSEAISHSIESRVPAENELPESDSETDLDGEEISKDSEIGENYKLEPIDANSNPTFKEVEAKASEFRKAIKNEASDLNKRHKFNLKFSDFSQDSPNFKEHISNIFGNTLVPEPAVIAEMELGELLDTGKFVQITANIEGYDIEHLGLDYSNIHSLPDMLVVIHNLNRLFKYKFMDIHDSSFQFNSILKSTLGFLEKNIGVECSRGEGAIIRSFIGKCIILLNTQVEDSLRIPGANNVHTNLIQTLSPDIETMNKSISRNGSRLNVSWLSFVNGLMSTDNKNAIYRHTSYKLLNDRLIACYGGNPQINRWFGLIEHFFGTILKSYIPSVICDYFYTLRSIYIVVRLITIYQTRELYKDKSPDEVATDLRMIGMLGSIIYESLFNSLRTLARSFPRMNGDSTISPQLQQYIHVHMICGGQYHFLRSFEKSIPILANSIVHR